MIALLLALPLAWHAPYTVPPPPPGGMAPAGDQHPATPAAAPPAPAVPPAPATPAADTAHTPPEPGPVHPDEFVGPVLPREVWIFIDRWKEFGGRVVRESDIEIEITDGEQTRRFNKGQVLEIVPLTQPRPGQQGLIQLRDGSQVRAVILSDTLEGVEFMANTLRGHLPRRQVYRVLLHADFNERYQLRKSLASREEHGRRLALAQWLVDEGRMDLAMIELDELTRDSDLEAAHDMLRSVRAQIKLLEAAAKRAADEAAAQQAKQAGAPDTAPAPGADPQADAPATGSSGLASQPAPTPPPGSTSLGAPTQRDLLPKDLLSTDDVNLIRVYEIDFRDPPAVRVQPEGIRQLILRYGNSSLIPATAEQRNALYRKPAIDVARLLFDLKARDLYRYIEVQEDPASIARFRTRVHNSWMIPNCATSRCHGGVQAGEFFLYTGNASDARIRYTNLMTLLSFHVDGRPVVNFETPADSLLIQYAMPRHMARHPHPDVKGWNPVFKTGTPQLLNDTVEWIRGMYQPRPEYPVEYKPPQLNAPDKPVRTIDGPDR